MPTTTTPPWTSVAGHCHWKRNGCGHITPFRITVADKTEYYCSQHIAVALRTSGQKEATVTIFDPPLRRDTF